MTTNKEINLKNEVFKNLSALIESKKVDISTVARGINMSVSTVSLYLQEKYTGNVENLENKLKNYLKVFQKQENIEYKSLKTIETSILKRIYNVANMCQLRGKMGVCYGSPGIGKTTAILEYQKENSGVIYVDPFEKTSARAVLQQIADQLKLNYYSSITLDDFSSNVIKKLEKNKHIIIVDEAENLKIEIFKVLRKIHDRTKNNCGLLFVGTEELSALLLKVRYGFPYISSRIGYIEQLDKLNIADVERLVLQYFPNCEKSLINKVATNCNYNARAIQNMLDLCVDIMKSNDITTLNIDVIDTAKEKLLI